MALSSIVERPTSTYSCHDIYYYSHVFPGIRAKHCNYATLLASIIFPMCSSLYSMLFFLVRDLPASSIGGVVDFLHFFCYSSYVPPVLDSSSGNEVGAAGSSSQWYGPVSYLMVASLFFR